MEVLHLPDNVKVHYAGAENFKMFTIPLNMGISYGLYTAYPYVSRLALKNTKINDIDLTIPRELAKRCKHLIQDSGLFTLMFGAKAGKKDASLMNLWYDKLVEFTIACNNKATIVEVDCQKVLGPEEAWRFRERMRNDLPLSNRIINVFHLEDGQKGLDRLIEYSEYIAISVPEMRFANKKNYVFNIAKYIKRKKPSIDIHLLGCTERELLHKCRFATSSDSTSHLSGVRYGTIKGKHIKYLKREEIVKIVGGQEYYDYMLSQTDRSLIDGLIDDIYMRKQWYQQAAGNQDYGCMLKK